MYKTVLARPMITPTRHTITESRVPNTQLRANHRQALATSLACLSFHASLNPFPYLTFLPLPFTLPSSSISRFSLILHRRPLTRLSTLRRCIAPPLLSLLHLRLFCFLIQEAPVYELVQKNSLSYNELLPAGVKL